MIIVIMFLIDKIDPLFFFISLFIGLFLCYVTAPTPDIIIKYPTPENAKNLIFKDRANNCYKFISEEVDCPLDENEISEIPIEEKQNSEN